MYKKRQRMYKDLTLNQDDEDPDFKNENDNGQQQEGRTSDHGSVISNVSRRRSEIEDQQSERNKTPDEGHPDNASASTSRPATVNRKEEPAYQPRSRNARLKTVKPVEIGYRKNIVESRRQEDGNKKARYDPELKKLIPKGAEWMLMPDPVRMQMRQILSDDYRKTLSNIAGSTTLGNLSRPTQRKGEKLLLPIASTIDKELRLTLIPGKIDTKLLDSGIPASFRKLNQQVEDSLRKVADFSIKVDEREAGLIPLRKELAELEKRYRYAKERHNSRMRGSENSRDYVQMLLLHPSSEQY